MKIQKLVELLKNKNGFANGMINAKISFGIQETYSRILKNIERNKNQ